MASYTTNFLWNHPKPGDGLYDYSGGMINTPDTPETLNFTKNQLPVIDTSNPKVNFAGFNFGNFDNNQATNDQYRGYNNYDGAQEYNPNYGRSFAGVGRFDPRNMIRPDNLTQDMGASTYTAPPVYPGSLYSPHRGFDEMQFSETVEAPEKTNWLTKGGNFLKKFSPTGIINALTFRKGADQSFGGYPDGTFSRAGLFPQEVSNLQALADQGLLRSGAKDAFGTNVVSQFGDYNQHIADKKAQFEAKLKDTDYLSRFENPDEINTLEDLYRAYQTKYGTNSAIARRLNHYANFGGTGTGTVADKITDKITVTKPGDGAVATGGGGGGFNPRFDRPAHPSSRPSWHGATKERQAAGKSVAGPGFGQGAYWAEGGRVGLYKGGDPTQWMSEQETITPFQLQQEEGVPMGLQASDDVNTRILENLFEKYLDLGFSPAKAEELAMEEFESMAQGPQEEIVEEGIASLV
jgi:hypothetical protein